MSYLPETSYAVLILSVVVLLIFLNHSYHSRQKLRRENNKLQNRIDHLEKHQTLLNLAMESAKAGTFDHSYRTDRTFWDARTAKMFGLGQADLCICGENVWETFIHQDDCVSTVQHMADAVTQNRNIDIIYRIVTDTGEIRHIHALGYILRDENGQAARVSGMNFDVTDRVKKSSALERAKEQAEAAKQAQSIFLANMSHEIRTPMNGVVGMAELLKQTETSKEQKGYIDTLQTSCNLLMAIVNDILDYSKIKADAMELEFRAINPRKIIAHCLMLLSETASHKQLWLTYYIHDEVPRKLKGDPTRFQQILLNLVSNAIKFTEDGGVHVEVEFDSHQNLKIQVQDSGIGMNETQLDKVFQRFTQADTTINRKYGGTGLGLSIVKHLIELWKGHYQISSHPGLGTNFKIVLPCDSVKAFTTKVEHGPIQCRSQIPEWLGKVFNRFNRQPFTGEPIAISVNPLENTLLVEGPSYTKTVKNPINLGQLLKNSYGHKSLPTSKANPLKPQYTDLRVLIVDDNPVNLMVMKKYLSSFGIDPIMARNGLQALGQAIAHQPDIVFMDNSMPEMDGMTASKQIRNYFDTQEMTIIGLSAHALQDSRESALAAGMNDYLSKPITLEKLQNSLNQVPVNSTI